MKYCMAIFAIAFLTVSCEQNDTKQRELKLKERELALKEQELKLKEKQILNPDTITKTKITPPLPSALNFAGRYACESATSTDMNTYPESNILTIKRKKDGSYTWTIEAYGYQHGYTIYGDGIENSGIGEFYFRGVKEGSYYNKEEELKRKTPFFRMKKVGKKYLTKFDYNDNYKPYCEGR